MVAIERVCLLRLDSRRLALAQHQHRALAGLALHRALVNPLAQDSPRPKPPRNHHGGVLIYSVKKAGYICPRSRAQRQPNGNPVQKVDFPVGLNGTI